MDKKYEFSAKNISKQTETTEVTVDPVVSSSDDIKLGSDGVTELLMMSVVTVTGFYCLYRKSKLHLDRVKIVRPNIFTKLAQPNCKKCRFFNRDSNLKCAVHPIKANDAAAERCPDYWQRDRRKFLHR